MIDTWLSKFKQAWINNDIEAVLTLFSEDVEYWETPYKKLAGFSDLANEWQAIHTQSDIQLDLRVFSSITGKHTVQWELRYKNENGEVQHWAGAYLIRLDESGLCNYFYQVGEKRS